MDAAKSETVVMNDTTADRRSERELVVTRVFDGPARIVFDAWTKPELFKRWWVPKSAGMTMLSCELDVRTGGTYRLVFQHPAFERSHLNPVELDDNRFGGARDRRLEARLE